MKRIQKIFLAAGAIMLLFSGCKRTPSAVDVLKEAVKNTHETQTFSGNMAVNMGVRMEEAGGVSVSMDLNIDMDMEAVRKTGAYHMKGEAGTGFMDFMTGIEVYGVPEKDGTNFFTYLYLDGYWTKMKNAVDEKKNTENLMNLENYIANGSELKMEGTETENGREVYVISTDGRGGLENTDVILNSLLGSQDISVDLKDINTKVTFKIYKDNGLPASVTSVFSGEDGEAFSVSDGVGEVDIENMKLTLSFKEFDTIDKIEVPDEAAGARLTE